MSRTRRRALRRALRRACLRTWYRNWPLGPGRRAPSSPRHSPPPPTITACPSPPLPTWHVAVTQPPIYITGDPVITCQGRHPQSPGLQGWRARLCSIGPLKSCPCLLALLSLATKLGVGSAGVGRREAKLLPDEPHSGSAAQPQPRFNSRAQTRNNDPLLLW